MANFFPISGGLQILNDSPVDSRYTVADQVARLGLPAAVVFKGLLVFQIDTSELYILTDISQANHTDGWTQVSSNGVESIEYTNGELIFTLEDGTIERFDLKALRDVNPIVNNGDGTYTYHFADGDTFTTEDFQAKDIESGTSVTSGDDVTITFEAKDESTFDVLVTDVRGPQGFRGFQGAYPVLVYRVGTITSDFTGDLTSTFDANALFSQDNGTPTDYLANKSGILADGEVYWIRQAIVDPSLVDTDGMLTLTWGTPYQEESGAGGATAGVIEYTNGSGGTLEVAQWIGTIAQYDALTDGIKNSEILFTITNDQTAVSIQETDVAYGDTDVLSYLNTNQYVGGITVAASQINLLDGKRDADLTNTQLQESDIGPSGFGFTKDVNTNLSKTDITGFGFVADSTTLAGYGITDAATFAQGETADTALQNLNGALLETTPATNTTEIVTVVDTSGVVTQGTVLVSDFATSTQGTTADNALPEPTLATSTAATLVTVETDSSDVVTRGTVLVSNFFQQGDDRLGVNRTAAPGFIDIQAEAGSPGGFRVYADNDQTGTIQFRNSTGLETAIRQDNDSGDFTIHKDGSDAITIAPSEIIFGRTVSGGGIPTFSVGTVFPASPTGGQEFYLDAIAYDTPVLFASYDGGAVSGDGTVTTGTDPVFDALTGFNNIQLAAGFERDSLNPALGTTTALTIYSREDANTPWTIIGSTEESSGNANQLRFRVEDTAAATAGLQATNPGFELGYQVDGIGNLGLYKYINATLGWLQITTS